MEIRYITEDEIFESHIAVERANGAHGNEVNLPLIAGALKGRPGASAVEDGGICDRLKTGYPSPTSVYSPSNPS